MNNLLRHEISRMSKNQLLEKIRHYGLMQPEMCKLYEDEFNRRYYYGKKKQIQGQ